MSFTVAAEEERHAEWVPDYIAENPPRRPWSWSSYDTEFSFVRPLLRLETLEPGSNCKPGSE